jgi:hypothetical protein
MVLVASRAGHMIGEVRGGVQVGDVNRQVSYLGAGPQLDLRE